jgi:hypothetical protein
VHSRKRGQRVRGDSVRVRLRLRLRGSELGAGDSKRELRCSVSRRAAGERAPRQAHTHTAQHYVYMQHRGAQLRNVPRPGTAAWARCLG